MILQRVSTTLGGSGSRQTSALRATPANRKSGDFRYARTGLTLLEVIVAMAIFLTLILVIGQLISMGTDRAMEIQQEARTSSRCQGKMAEVMIGAQPLSSAGSYAPFEDSDSDLQWRVGVESGPGTGLFLVKVSVKKDMGNGSTIETQLSQIILDPSSRGTSLDCAIPPATPAAPTTPTNGM